MVKALGRIGMVKSNLMKNKKGSLIDMIFIAVGLVVFAVAVLISFKVVSEFNTNIQANADIPTEAKTAVNTLEGHYSGVLDKTFLLCY